MTVSARADPFSVLNHTTANGAADVEHVNIMLLFTKTSYVSEVNVDVINVVLYPL